MTKQRVLHIVGSFHQGGSEFQAVQLIKLLRGDASVDVFVATLNKSGPLLSMVEELGVSYVPEFPLTSFYNWNFVRQVFNCVGFIKANGISIVQAHDFYTNVFGMVAAAVAGAPVRIAAKRETGMRTPTQLFIERRAFNLATNIVVNADAVKSYLADSGVAESKIRTIYNGINLQRLASSGRPRNDVLKGYGILPTTDTKVVTILANLRSTVKNHHMFLRSADSVRRSMPSAVFVVAGEGPLLSAAADFARELDIADRTFFIGRCQDVGELLSVTDIGVLTSDSEGLPNAILEYMAASLPVVATSVGGVGELVSEGQTGFLVRPNDHEQMAERLIELLHDTAQARAFGINAIERVARCFSVDVQLQRTLGLYRGVVNL